MNHVVEKDWTYRQLRCVVIVTDRGHRCGYVGLPKSHPLWGHCYDYIEVHVHGGLTYSEGHTNYPAPHDGLWWLGFDCAHSSDAPDPQYIAEEYMRTWLSGGTVRTLDFCVAECMSMVDQIINMYGELSAPINVQLEDDLFTV